MQTTHVCAISEKSVSEKKTCAPVRTSKIFINPRNRVKFTGPRHVREKKKKSIVYQYQVSVYEIELSELASPRGERTYHALKTRLMYT